LTFDPKNRPLLVTGATGFLGRNLLEALAQAGYTRVTGLCRKDYDLLEQAEVRRMFADHKPDVVVHLAALSAGIKANDERPADFYYTNMLMQTMVLHEAWRAGVRKYLTCMGGCSYPAHAPSPIHEREMWNGFPQLESAGYSMAKKMNIVQAWAYRKQHKFDAIVTVPGNMYGPYDNYNLNESHVIPALIRKVYEAMQRGDAEIVAWGTGAPVRDFVYVKDVARALVVTLEQYDGDEFFNISSGTQTTIKELYDTVVAQMGFGGVVRWDTSRPDGQMFKGFDVTRMKQLIGMSCTTSLQAGLAETIRWFKDNYATPGAIRL
jgi:GDP-L-fucose synthase